MGEGNGTQAADQAICAVATRASKALNQDAVACGAGDDIAVVAVADGISETGPRSAIVAQAAAGHIVKRVLDQSGLLAPADQAADLTIFSNHWFDDLFAAFPHVCQDALAAAGEGSESEEALSPKSSLIAAISLPDELIIVYAGDGAAKLTTGRLVVVRNLLMPHWNDNGHLTRYVSAEAAVQPTIIRVRTNFDEGHIVLIGSDGAFPNRANDPTAFIIDTLKQQLTEDRAHQSSDEIGAVIMAVLEQAIGGRPLEDDASLGLILSRRTLNYWRQSIEPLAPATEETDVSGEVPDADA